MLLRRWTVLDSAVIHSRETTSAGRKAPRAVFLHGVGTTSRYARPLLQALEGRMSVAAPELPGIGASSASELPRDVAAQADLLARWMQRRSWSPATVIGNSMGAQTAVELAVSHPHLVSGLVLLGPTVDASDRNISSQASKLLVDATVERPSLVVMSVTDSLLTSRRAVACYLRAAFAHHIEERIGSVDVPALVVRGARDPLAPRRWVRELADLAPHGRWTEVAGAAHACHHGRPGAVASLVAGLATVSPTTLRGDGSSASGDAASSPPISRPAARRSP